MNAVRRTRRAAASSGAPRPAPPDGGTCAVRFFRQARLSQALLGELAACEAVEPENESGGGGGSREKRDGE